MKHFTLFFAMLMTVCIATAQETEVELSVNQNYTKELYFKFATNTSERFDADAWEIAFLRTGAFEFGERINTYSGIEVYEASTNPEDYVTVNPAEIDSWTRLYNSDTSWEEGAFDQGSASYGWGEYNPANHHITGQIVYVLKYIDGSFKRFMIEDFFNGYTFKYATWEDASSIWINEQSVTLSNDTNPNKMFNHYNLSTNQAVVTSPDMSDWDLGFMKYETSMQDMMYPVVGALQNAEVNVAKNSYLEVEDMEELTFSTNINSVGFDWKELDGNFEYMVTPDTYYFLEDANDRIFRFYFTSYEGASTGNFSLAYEDVTETLDVESFDENNTVRIYPNPSSDGLVNVLYDTNYDKVNIALYNMSGRKIMEKEVSANGFNNMQLNLSELSSGVYLLQYTAGDFTTTKKLILN